MGSGDVSDLEIRIDAAAKRIGALKDRIHYMEQARIEQLSSLLNDVEDARAKAIKRLEAKHKDIVRNHNRLKIEFLNSAVQTGRLLERSTKSMLTLINVGAQQALSLSVTGHLCTV